MSLRRRTCGLLLADSRTEVNQQLPAVLSLLCGWSKVHATSVYLPPWHQGFSTLKDTDEAEQTASRRWQTRSSTALLFPASALPLLSCVPSTAQQLRIQHNLIALRLFSAKPSSSKPKGVPDAEDCDEAIEDYRELRSRLDSLKRPSTMRTLAQTAGDLLKTVISGGMASVRFVIKIPKYISNFQSMPKEVWAAKKAGMWKTVKHEAHHYWVRTAWRDHACI